LLKKKVDKSIDTSRKSVGSKPEGHIDNKICGNTPASLMGGGGRQKIQEKSAKIGKGGPFWLPRNSEMDGAADGE